MSALEQAKQLYGEALECHNGGRADLAETKFLEALALLGAAPQRVLILAHLSGLMIEHSRFDEARKYCEIVIQAGAANELTWMHLGLCHLGRSDHEQALECLGKALTINPEFADAHLNRGNVLADLKRFDLALASYDKAAALNPDFVDAHYNRAGLLQQDPARLNEALASYDKAIALDPAFAKAHNNRGLTLEKFGRYEEALACYDRAIALAPALVEAHNNRGLVLQTLDRFDEALATFETAVALKPDFVETLDNRGNLLLFLNRYTAAAASYEAALMIEPATGHPCKSMLVYAKMQSADWSAHRENADGLVADVRAGIGNVHPFSFLGTSDSAPDQLRCAQNWARRNHPSSAPSEWNGQRHRHDRIRIAYLSADFREHAVSYLLAGLFERHDRSVFEPVAISFGADSASAMRARLSVAFERFIDVRKQSDFQVANLMRELEIDIAVDLMGFTASARTKIFAMRAAPIQVNYLGFPGTMGAEYIDYILADRFVIPEDRRQHYAEKVVYLPDVFQANDSGRRITRRAPARADAGLPETGFIFCAFNNTYKITPRLFDIWMRLLGKVEGSVLLLLGMNDAARRNLQRHAQERGVEPGRLVFVPHIAYADHLARYQIADLFLDTLPFNAGTTASDALWGGLPLVTCSGDAFAARMAGSVLHAIGLPELITRSLEEYEALALKLATDAKLLAAIRAKLARNRETYPVFDTDRFRRHIEAAYVTMWERYQRGEPPESFAVEAIAQPK